MSKVAHLNFVGNVEPRAMTEGKADVVVCDGFIGNLFLKTTEAVASFMGKMIREQFESTSMSKIGAVLARKALLHMKQKVDPNEYPGAPLLGINGTVVILHGSCSPRGVENAILGTRVAVEGNLIEHIRENILKLRTVETENCSGSGACTPGYRRWRGDGPSSALAQEGYHDGLSLPGQGSQQSGAVKSFRDSCEEAQALFMCAAQVLPSETLEVILEGGQEDISHTSYAQPGLLCTEIMAAALLKSLGVFPSVVAGHSLGEISALVATGALEFETALSLVQERARLMSENIPDGGMAAVIGLPRMK